MGQIINIKTPLHKGIVRELKAGDQVSINGTIYTARDAAHKRIVEMLKSGQKLPFDLKDQIIYYVGPCPARPGEIIGSAGPTTSGRMDAYAPLLLELGLTGMIGKGIRSGAVIDAMIKNCAVYFGATGGAGALIAESVIAEEIQAFPELGPEAVRKLEVRDFKATVIIDCHGNNLYVSGKEGYRI
jgi:fumarate hydratase subunit beta